MNNSRINKITPEELEIFLSWYRPDGKPWNKRQLGYVKTIIQFMNVHLIMNEEHWLEAIGLSRYALETAHQPSKQMIDVHKLLWEL